MGDCANVGRVFMLFSFRENMNALQTNENSTNFDLAKAFKLYYKNGLSLQETADYFGIPKATLYTRLARITELLPNSEEVKMYRENKVEMLSGLEYKVVCNMLTDEKLKDASFNNLAYGFQQIATQNRLEQGLATERIDSFSVTASLSDLSRRKQELMDKVMSSIQPVVLDTISTPSIIPDKQDK